MRSIGCPFFTRIERAIPGIDCYVTLAMSTPRSRFQARTRRQTDSPNPELGRFLKKKRLKARQSLAATAGYLEISTELLTEYEQGIRGIPLMHVYALSNFLNVSPTEVLHLIRSIRPR